VMRTNARWPGFLLIGAVCALLTAARPALDSALAPRKEAQRQRRLLEAELRVVQNAPSVRRELQTARAALQREDRLLLTVQESAAAQAEALHYVETVARISQVNLDLLQAENPPASSAGHRHVVAIPLSISVNGTTGNVFALLRLLEGGAALRIERLTVGRAEQQPGRLELTASVTMFGWRNGDGS